ncbi:MAG: elongation factor P maturation arginine rhamnosyltransferase EarP, partial [Lautropia sp.]|nr:elongation factor P maturation arginine rhamnosyltransferase EarP [Lautropia sp.]
MPASPVQPRPSRWHLVCRVIDNFGDVGVMWRLVRQLHDEHGVQVDFFIDQPECLRLMAPGIRVAGEDDAAESAANAAGMSGSQRGVSPFPSSAADGGIRVHRLDEAAPVGVNADVIVAGFQARLPEAARRRLLSHAAPTPAAPLLIQLDYLSAEGWIDDTHGLPSLHPDGLREWFFNPGFGRNNGGLLIERDLLARRDAFLASPAGRDEWLRTHGVQTRPGECLISVLAYPTAPLRGLLEGWLRTARHDGGAEPPCHAAQEYQALPRHGGKALAPEAPMRPMRPTRPTLHLLIPGAATQPHLLAEARAVAAQANGRLRVSALPFLPQPAFDELLWCCDINLVRGEDSWIRALWAEKPWLWHAYPQAEETHLEKLDAFVARVRVLMSSVPSSGGESPVSPETDCPDTPNGPGRNDPAGL